MAREQGYVKWYDEVKGYGFITAEGGGKDYFVHRSGVETLTGRLEKGDRVEYEVTMGAKGPQAKDVRLVEEG